MRDALCLRPRACKNEHGTSSFAHDAWGIREDMVGAPGAGMAADIAEQPEVYARLLQPAHAGSIVRAAATIVERRPRHVVLTARGTSDHAALYGAYLAEIRL